MDIVSHTLSGIAVSTIVASFSNKKLPTKGLILFCGAVGGALPDIDAFSLLIERSDIYFSNHWYSHHQFFHSIIAGLLITFLLFGGSY